VSTQHTRTALAAGTCISFGLAVAVAAGAVPRPADPAPAPRPVTVAAAVAAPSGGLPSLVAVVTKRHDAAPLHRAVTATRNRAHVAAKAGAHAVAAPHARVHPSDPVQSITVEPVAAEGKTAEAANIKHQAPHHKKKAHHKKKHHHKRPATPKKAARTTPSGSALSAAVSGLRSYVHTPFTPTNAQVAQFGDAVCTAFDEQKTFSQVKAQILEQVKKLPFTTVTAGAADYVVKTAVSLYCPGYESKVS
jgi:hypothetical protein